jgi:hypothetical protein
MTPTYGKCGLCLAWTRYTYDEDGTSGVCRFAPQAVAKDAAEGCWCFIGKLTKDAFVDPGYPNREYKPSHEALEDVGPDGKKDR